VLSPEPKKKERGKQTMRQSKQELRQIVKKERFALPQDDREKKSRKICSCLLDILDGYSPVMVYISKPVEVNTEPLVTALIAQGLRVIVPIIEKETVNLRLSYLDDPSVLVDSTFHVPEPIGNEIPAKPEEIKVAIIPVLGFDLTGNRLGYGSGYYDRFLAKNPKIKRIGLAFACQKITAIPCEENDVKMDLIVTEAGIYRCGRDPAKGA